MAFKHRLADVSYWLYDRGRHKSAFEAAAQPGTASDFAGLHGHKYALLITFRGDGTAVPTPVWFALLDDHHLVIHTEERTAKVRRIRRDPRARVFPCDPRGMPLGPGVEGTARILEAADERERAEAALDRHYGRPRRLYEKVMTAKGGGCTWRSPQQCRGRTARRPDGAPRALRLRSWRDQAPPPGVPAVACRGVALTRTSRRRPDDDIEADYSPPPSSDTRRVRSARSLAPRREPPLSSAWRM
jgi:uncharacterized protein